MSVKSVQFAVAAHIMAALGFVHGEEISSATLAEFFLKLRTASREHSRK